MQQFLMIELRFELLHLLPQRSETVLVRGLLVIVLGLKCGLGLEDVIVCGLNRCGIGFASVEEGLEGGGGRGLMVRAFAELLLGVGVVGGEGGFGFEAGVEVCLELFVVALALGGIVGECECGEGEDGEECRD